MAAISIKDSDDPVGVPGRIDLRGRTVAGYFLEEVLYREPPDVIDFMLATSVLDEMSTAACTALCGEGAAALLEVVYRANLFVLLVDDEARTYRYLHLIREVLRAELHASDPVRERQLQKTAAKYLEDIGQVGPAARHLLAAGHAGEAFSLLSERFPHDFSVNPMVGSALDLDEVQPDLFAGRPSFWCRWRSSCLCGARSSGARVLPPWPSRPASTPHDSPSWPSSWRLLARSIAV